MIVLVAQQSSITKIYEIQSDFNNDALNDEQLSHLLTQITTLESSQSANYALLFGMMFTIYLDYMLNGKEMRKSIFAGKSAVKTAQKAKTA